jgi:RHS repeat-associated protein
MKWTLINQSGTNDPDTGDIYSGLDRFGRVKDNRWLDGGGDDLDRIQYGYDRAGNRIWRKNVVAAALGKQFDELYTYDGVHRLKDMVRGTLNSGHTGLTSETFAESWTLDSTGNWRGFKQDDNGDGTWSLVQSRTANPVNEITDMAETVGPSWVTPAYNRAGNMTTMPQPADPTASYTATYDAWNRLVKIADGMDTVSEYAYDGAKRRIVQKSYDGGTLDETRQLYYTVSWQVIEERIGTSPDSADAERQFVWGKRYIDNLVVRDRDTSDSGTLDERLYACQDDNWNVTSDVMANSSPNSRYAYSPYGTPNHLSADWNGLLPQTNSCCSFGGIQLDRVTSFYFFRTRVFNSALGLFTRRDLVGYRSSLSLALFLNSNPLRYVDPFGMEPWDHGVFDGPNIDAWFKRSKKNEDGCVRLPLQQYLDIFAGNAQIPIEVGKGAWRGCVGLVSVYQQCKPPVRGNPNPFPTWPEQDKNTQCFLTPELANAHPCPAGRPDRFNFVIEGPWGNVEAPFPEFPNDPVPPGTINTEYNPGGDYNYISVISANGSTYCVWLDHARRNERGYIEYDPRVAENPDDLQMLVICPQNKKCRSEDRGAVYCVTCRCKG